MPKKRSLIGMRSFFFPSSKKGFELAIGTLVVMILGIIIVAGGITLVAKISKSGTATVTQISNEQHTALKQLLANGQLVAVYPSSQVIVGGKSGTYALAVQNRASNAQTFGLQTSPSDPHIKVNLIRTLALKENDQADAIIVVTPDDTTPAGKYTVLVTVLDGTGQVYDSKRFFEVVVQ